MKRTLLITGFDPFGGAAVNPAWQAVQLLPDTVGNYRIRKLPIPTVFGKAADLVIREADAIRAKASADIAMEKRQAVNDAKNEISVIAVAIAGKVVGRELNAADHSRLVDEFIDELGEGV